MAPCLELLRVSATDLYRTDGAKSVQQVLEILAATDGHLSTYVGTEIQDPNYWWAVVVWESQAHHQALIDNKEVYPTLVKALFQGAEKLDFMNHVVLAPKEPYPALDAPITEIATWKVREGANKEQFAQLLDEGIHKIVETPSISGGGYGVVAEDDRKYVEVLGWNSLEEFKSIVGSSPLFGEPIAKLKSYADLEVKHLALKKQSA